MDDDGHQDRRSDLPRFFGPELRQDGNSVRSPLIKTAPSAATPLPPPPGAGSSSRKVPRMAQGALLLDRGDAKEVLNLKVTL